MVMIPIRFPGSTPSTDDEPPSGTPQIRRSLDLGAENPNVSEALGIFGSDRSWFGLYKISDIVWHDVGTRIVGKGGHPVPKSSVFVTRPITRAQARTPATPALARTTHHHRTRCRTTKP
jgi:hypothetical protein